MLAFYKTQEKKKKRVTDMICIAQALLSKPISKKSKYQIWLLLQHSDI